MLLAQRGPRDDFPSPSPPPFLLEGLVYPDFLDNYIIEPFEIPEAWPRYGGIDWGFNNPMVALHSAMSPQGILYFYKEVRVERKLLDDLFSCRCETPLDILSLTPPERKKLEEELKEAFLRGQPQEPPIGFLRDQPSEKLDDEVIDFLADSIAKARAVRQWFDLTPDDEAFLRSLGIKVKDED